MILIIYHAEELKRDVINGVAARQRWRGKGDAKPGLSADSTRQGQKQKHAFDFLVKDGVLTPEERDHLVGLIGRRNGIAHHLDQVTADLTTARSLRDWIDYISLAGTALVGLFDPGWPENRYERGRLTPRGVETCYQLFDMGKSTMAVAHLMDLTLESSRRRERQWRSLGGPKRQKRVLAEIPRARIRYRLDD